MNDYSFIYEFIIKLWAIGTIMLSVAVIIERKSDVR